MIHAPIHLLIHPAIYVCVQPCRHTYIFSSRLLISDTQPSTPTFLLSSLSLFLPLPYAWPSFLPDCMPSFLPPLLIAELPSRAELRCRDRALCCPRSPPLLASSPRWPYSRYVHHHNTLHSAMSCFEMTCHDVLCYAVNCDCILI